MARSSCSGRRRWTGGGDDWMTLGSWGPGEGKTDVGCVFRERVCASLWTFYSSFRPTLEERVDAEKSF